MEDDIDIYGDLPCFEAKHEDTFASPKQGGVSAEYAELKRQVAELTAKLVQVTKVNENLEVNVSSLLKTAKAEIARKDKMIDNLRRELEDAAFRRGTYAKASGYAARRAIREKAHTSAHRDFQNEPRPQPDENAYQLIEVQVSDDDDEAERLNRETDLKKASMTVFGERLRKKIAEEAMAERMEKQLTKYNDDNGYRESPEGYIVESDKENSSQRNGQFLDLKVSQAHSVVRDSNANINFQDSKDPRTVERKEDDAVRQKPAGNAKHPEKRPRDEASSAHPLKRMKTEREEQWHEQLATNDRKAALKIEYDEENVSEYDEHRGHSGWSVKKEDTSASAERKQRYNFGPTGRRNEANETVQQSNGSREKRDVDEYNSKRQSKFADKSKFSAEMDNLVRSSRDESTKGSKWFDHRRANDHKYNDHRNKYRDKQKSDYRTKSYLDHRSRGKLSPDCRYRDERYRRTGNWFDNHPVHTSKVQKVNDAKKNDLEKSKPKEQFDLRNSLKRSATEGKANNGVSSACNQRISQYKLLPIEISEERLTASERKLENVISKTSRDFSKERTFERPSYVEKSQHNGENDGERVNRLDHLEDGEIPDSDVTTVDEVGRRSRLDSTGPGTSSLENEKKSVPAFDSLPRRSPVAESAARNVENNESFEDVENIKKFIRDYDKSQCQNSQPDLAAGCSKTSDEVWTTGERRDSEAVNAIVETLDRTPSKEVEQNEVFATEKTSDEFKKLEGSQTSTEDDSKTATDASDLPRTSKRLSGNFLQQKSAVNETNKNVPLGHSAEGENFTETKKSSLPSAAARDLPKAVKATSASVDDVHVSDKGVAGQRQQVQDAKDKKKNVSDEKARKPALEKLSVAKSAPVKVQGKLVVVARRKKPVRLADNNASMTVLVNQGNSSVVDAHPADDSKFTLKPRACKLARVLKTT